MSKENTATTRATGTSTPARAASTATPISGTSSRSGSLGLTASQDPTDRHLTRGSSAG